MTRAFRTWSLGRYGFVSPEVALALGSAGSRLQAEVYLTARIKSDAVDLARKVQGLVAAPSMTDRYFRIDQSPIAQDLAVYSWERPACFVHEVPARMGSPVLELMPDGTKQVGTLGLVPGLNGMRFLDRGRRMRAAR